MVNRKSAFLDKTHHPVITNKMNRLEKDSLQNR